MVLKRYLAVLALLFVAGCHSGGGSATGENHMIEPVSPSQVPQLPPGKAAVVLGMSVRSPMATRMSFAPTDETWIRVDLATHLRLGNDLLEALTPCGLLHDCDADTGKTVQYQLYLVEPGTYALGCVENGSMAVAPSAFQLVTVTASGCEPSLKGKQKPDTPSFTAAPDSVTYVGDLVFDYGQRVQWVLWSLQRNDAAARAFLAPSGLAGRMSVQPMIHANGTPLGQGDGDYIKDLPRR